MQEDVSLNRPLIIIPSIQCTSLPGTQILNADIPKLREQLLFLQLELGIPEKPHYARTELTTIIDGLPQEKLESVVNYLRTQILLNRFDQAEAFAKAMLANHKFQGTSELFLVLAEASFHQGHLVDASFYLAKSYHLPASSSFFQIKESLAQQIPVASDIIQHNASLSAAERREKYLAMDPAPFIPFLNSSLEAAFQEFQSNDYLSVYNIITPFLSYSQGLSIHSSSEMKLLTTCLKSMVVASKIGLFVEYRLEDYEEFQPMLASLMSMHFDSQLKELLHHSSEEIRNPLSKMIKENAGKIIACCNSAGVSLFQEGVRSYDNRFFHRAREVFKIQEHLTDILFPNMKLGREARMHVLSCLNHSDAALAKENLGDSYGALLNVIQFINGSDSSMPTALAAASSLRIAAMTHAISVHLNQCLDDLTARRSRLDHFPEYLSEQHPEFLGVWKDHLNGVRILTPGDLSQIGRSAVTLKGNSIYSYNQFRAFGSQITNSVLGQSDWTEDLFYSNLEALMKGEALEHHSFRPLDLDLAS